MKLSFWCGLTIIGLLGCSSKGGGSPSASASAGTVKATCEDAGRRYGEFTAKMMIADPRNPLPAEKRKLIADPIRDATVKSCQEDKWEDLPLSCLASVFDKPPKDDDTIDKYTDVCVKSVGREKLDKMDQRVARAMADAVGPAPSSASAAPMAGGSAATDSAASGTARSSPAATSASPSRPPPAPAPPANKAGPASPVPKPAPKPPSQGQDPFE